jgi:hypothetical protein
MRPGVQQTGFVQAMVAAAETVAAEPIAPASGRMAIEIEKNRRVIVDVDAAALALAILEWLGVASEARLSRSAAGCRTAYALANCLVMVYCPQAQCPERFEEVWICRT